MAGMPAGAIEHEDGMSTGSHGAADLPQMGIHGFAVGIGHHQGGADGALGADGTEQVGPFGAPRRRALPVEEGSTQRIVD